MFHVKQTKMKSPLRISKGGFLCIGQIFVENLVFIIGAIHLDWLRIITNAPHTAWAHTSTDTATDTSIRIGLIAPGTILMLYTSNSLLWA